MGTLLISEGSYIFQINTKWEKIDEEDNQYGLIVGINI